MPAPLIAGNPPLPPALAVEFGAVHAVAAVGDAQAGRFLWGALLNAARPSIPAWLLTAATTPPALAAPDELAAPVAAALDGGRIRILRHRLVNPAPEQVRTMLDEFDYFAIAPESLLFIDCGDRWLGKRSRVGRSPLIELLRQWAQRRRVAVVLLFHAEVGARTDRATEMLGFAPHLAGIARLTGDAGGAAPRSVTCHLLFWFNAASVTADTVSILTSGEDGRLRVADMSAGPATDRQVALDADTVYAMRAALAGSGGAPPHWILCDTVDELLARTAGAQAATVILGIDRTMEKDTLMRAVFGLRRQAGNRLKIIVRELQIRLRYNEETLLARLGASLVVPMEVSYTRLLSMMEMLQNQSYAGVLPATFEAAFADSMPEAIAGYLPPPAFARAVTETLARSRSLAIDNVLVRLTLVNGLTAVDAMRHCTVKRAGDVYSCDRKNLFVFLFACREIDATQTLERIFTLPVGELFASEHRYISNIAAQAAIEEFARRAATGRLPDLSAELDAIAALRLPAGDGRAGPEGTVSAIDPRPAGAVPRPPVAPPRRTPLRLRSS